MAMIYVLTQIVYQMQAEIYPDLSGRGDIKQRRGSPLHKRESPTMQTEIYPALSGRGDITLF